MPGASEQTSRGCARASSRPCRRVVSRLGLFRPCAECGRVFPPESTHNWSYCQGCAQRNHGFIY